MAENPADIAEWMADERAKASEGMELFFGEGFPAIAAYRRGFDAGIAAGFRKGAERIRSELASGNLSRELKTE